MRTSLLSFLTVITLICSAHSQECQVEPARYNERAKIEHRYDVEVGNDYVTHKSVADALLNQKKEIDRDYARFMLYAEHRPQCCPTESQDLISKHFCALVRYRASNRTGIADFLADIPKDKQSAHALWVLDEIALGTSQQDSTGLPFAPYGPVQDYLGGLFRLTEQGNPAALRKFLTLYSFADGEYAESLEDETERLFTQHPEIVVTNWETIRKYPGLLSDMREMMSNELMGEVSSKLQRQCSLQHRECAEILSALK